MFDLNTYNLLPWNAIAINGGSFSYFSNAGTVVFSGVNDFFTTDQLSNTGGIVVSSSNTITKFTAYCNSAEVVFSASNTNTLFYNDGLPIIISTWEDKFPSAGTIVTVSWDDKYPPQ